MIPKKSPKRKLQDVAYAKACKQVEQESIQYYGELTCFFCLTEIDKQRTGIEHHHVAGRDGENMVNPKGIVCAHPSCHTGRYGYHSLPLSMLIHKSYLPRLLEKVKEVDYDAYSKMVYRLREAGYEK